MEHKIATNNSVTEVVLTGRLTFQEQHAFREMLQKLENEASSKWVIDIRDLEYVDSAGLGLMLRAQAIAGKAQKNITLRVSPDGQVRTMLDNGRFDMLIPFES